MDCLQKKRKRNNSKKDNHNSLQNNMKNFKSKNYTKEESIELNKENKSNNKDQITIYNPKFTQFYHSSSENILYISKFKNKRFYNEDKILISCQENSKFKLHLFSIFDGHNGDKCCEFLVNNFDKILFSNKNILQKPARALKETYIDCENKFFNLNIPKNLLTPIEKSGSCALSLLVIGKKIYSANAGDSRALYSEKGSKEVYQISYEHKPHNEIQRIIKAGGHLGSPVLYGIWRLLPGEIAVSIIK